MKRYFEFIRRRPDLFLLIFGGLVARVYVNAEKECEKEKSNDAHDDVKPLIDSVIGPIVGWHSTQVLNTGYILLMICFAITFFKIIYQSVEDFWNRFLWKKYRFYKYLPESGWLIIVGVVIGGLMLAFGISSDHELLQFNEEVFFILLIPPIILHAGYGLDQKFFFKNLGLILLYALLGTLVNTIALGSIVYGLRILYIHSYSFIDCLLVGSLMSAVDPVAVLAIFEDLKVNETLNILVFGESVVNDAMSIVLYRLFEALRVVEDAGEIGDQPFIIYLLLGIVKFFYVSIGGLSIGVGLGLIAALTSRFTTRLKLIEPLIVISYGFLAYFLAESILCSGIMSILFCGIVMNRYVELNLDENSHITIHRGMSLIGMVAENLIFIYLGMEIVLFQHLFDPWFVVFSLLFVVLLRFIIIYVIGALDNLLLRKKRKGEHITFGTLFIISFGGLRGAIAFALAFIIPDDEKFSKQRRVIVTTTLIIILYTIFIAGALIRPMIKLFRIQGLAQTKKELKRDLQGEQDFLYHEEKEVSSAIDKIQFLEHSVLMSPSGRERDDFIVANRSVIEKSMNIIILHVDNIIADLEKMNRSIKKLMEIESLDKNNKDHKEVMSWRLSKAESIRETWASELEQMDVKERFNASTNVNDVINYLRSQLYQLSKKPEKVEEAYEYEIDSTADQFNETINNFNPDDFKESNFIEVLHLHDFLEFHHDSYHTVPWARDDDYLFYLDRSLLLESMKSWNKYAHQLMASNPKDLEQALSLLIYLRNLIHIQIENRLKEIIHLKQEDFGQTVLGFGIKRAFPLTKAIAKRNYFKMMLKRMFWRIDDFIQRIVVRGLHSDEQKLVTALIRLRKDESEERAVHELNVALNEVMQNKDINKYIVEKSIKEESKEIDKLILPSFMQHVQLRPEAYTNIPDDLAEWDKNSECDDQSVKSQKHKKISNHKHGDKRKKKKKSKRVMKALKVEVPDITDDVKIGNEIPKTTVSEQEIFPSIVDKPEDREQSEQPYKLGEYQFPNKVIHPTDVELGDMSQEVKDLTEREENQMREALIVQNESPEKESKPDKTSSPEKESSQNKIEIVISDADENIVEDFEDIPEPNHENIPEDTLEEVTLSRESPEPSRENSPHNDDEIVTNNSPPHNN